MAPSDGIAPDPASSVQNPIIGAKLPPVCLCNCDVNVRFQVVITGKENLTGYKATPAVIRYFCKTCCNRVYGARLDDDGNEQMLVRDGAIAMALICPEQPERDELASLFSYLLQVEC